MKNSQKFAFFLMICAFLMVGVFISPKSNNSLEKTVMGNQNLLTTDLLEIPNDPKTQTSNPQPLLDFSVPNPSLALIEEDNLYYYLESDNGTLNKLYGLSKTGYEDGYGWARICTNIGQINDMDSYVDGAGKQYIYICGPENSNAVYLLNLTRLPYSGSILCRPSFTPSHIAVGRDFYGDLYIALSYGPYVYIWCETAPTTFTQYDMGFSVRDIDLGRDSSYNLRVIAKGNYHIGTLMVSTGLITTVLLPKQVSCARWYEPGEQIYVAMDIFDDIANGEILKFDKSLSTNTTLMTGLNNVTDIALFNGGFFYVEYTKSANGGRVSRYGTTPEIVVDGLWDVFGIIAQKNQAITQPSDGKIVVYDMTNLFVYYGRERNGPSAPSFEKSSITTNSSSIQINWTASTDLNPISKYWIKTSTSRSFATNETYSTTTTSLNISLYVGNNYIMVKAVDELYNEGEWSTVLQVTYNQVIEVYDREDNSIPGYNISLLLLIFFLGNGIYISHFVKKKVEMC